MTRGQVKWFNAEKHFGWIFPADGSGDIFVHSSGVVEGEIREDDWVTFEIVETVRGRKAVDVRRLDT